MSRGRKPLSAPEQLDGNIDHKAVAAASQAADGANAKRLRTIEELYGDGDIYHLETCIHGAQMCLAQSADAMLRGGRYLIRIKEHEPHGRFMEALDRIGVDDRVARRLMQAAVKFSGSKRRLVADLGKTKLLELLAEDDEVLDSLEKGGTVAGLTLDDIQTMSASNLRKALRDERRKRREEAEANERLLVDKARKIDELDREVHRQANDLPAIVQQIRLNCCTYAGDAITGIEKLAQMREQILNVPLGEHDKDSTISAMAVTYHLMLNQILARLHDELAHAENYLGGYLHPGLHSFFGESPSEEQIQEMNNAGAEEALRVAGGTETN